MELYSQSALRAVVEAEPELKAEVRDRRDLVYRRAEINLEDARASTTHHKMIGPSHLTKITKQDGEGATCYASMDAPNAVAIEFGHGPSGYFSRENFGHVTKAPAGLYILTRAAGVAAGNLNMVPAEGRRR